MFKKPISEITYQDVVDFIDVDEFETSTTDAKKQWAFEKILRDITEFANTYGGILLVGVEEVKNATSRPYFRVVGVPYSPKDRETLENKVLTLTYPPIRYEIAKVDLPGGGGNCVWIVRVRESDEAPHEVRINSEHVIPGRYGTRGRTLSLAEIKALLARQQSTETTTPELFAPVVTGQHAASMLELAARPLRPRITPILRADDESAFTKQVSLRFFGRVEKSEELLSSRTVEIGLVLQNARDPGWLHYKLDNSGRVGFYHQASESLGSTIDAGYLIERVVEFLWIYHEFLTGSGQKWKRSVLHVRLSPPKSGKRHGVPEAQRSLIVESPTRVARPDEAWVNLTLPIEYDQPSWHTIRDVIGGILREHGHLPDERLLNENCRRAAERVGLDQAAT